LNVPRTVWRHDAYVKELHVTLVFSFVIINYLALDEYLIFPFGLELVRIKIVGVIGSVKLIRIAEMVVFSIIISVPRSSETGIPFSAISKGSFSRSDGA
jgi:hypothetical protein